MTNEDRMEYVGFALLLGFVVFAMTPSFWSLIVFLGR
jgi:hypothetical protein